METPSVIIAIPAYMRSSGPKAGYVELSAPDLFAQLDRTLPAELPASAAVWIRHTDIDPLSEVKVAGAHGLLRIPRPVAEVIARALAGEQANDETRERAAVVYRRLAQKYHPDRSPENAEVMADINELYQAATARRR
jgi:hypothetical protein